MRTEIDEAVIGDIADYLDMGMQCFYHLPTGTMEYHPDMDNSDVEPEWWQEVLDKIKAERNNYFEIKPMVSRGGFQIMEDFAEAQTDPKFKTLLLERLRMRKPFRNFRDAVDESEYRDDWFAFKKKIYMDWVREQIEEKIAAILHFQDKMNSGEPDFLSVVSDEDEDESPGEPLNDEKSYRYQLVTAYQNILNFKNELFTDALNIGMAGDMKEINEAFEEGDVFTFSIEHLENSNDVNLQKLVTLLKQMDDTLASLANLNAIQESELD